LLRRRQVKATSGIEGLIDALAAAFKARGVQGLSGRNLRNYRQIALTWPRFAIRQMPSDEFGGTGQIWQTLSAESLTGW